MTNFISAIRKVFKVFKASWLQRKVVINNRKCT